MSKSVFFSSNFGGKFFGGVPPPLLRSHRVNNPTHFPYDEWVRKNEIHKQNRYYERRAKNKKDLNDIGVFQYYTTKHVDHHTDTRGFCIWRSDWVGLHHLRHFSSSILQSHVVDRTVSSVASNFCDQHWHSWCRGHWICMVLLPSVGYARTFLDHCGFQRHSILVVYRIDVLCVSPVFTRGQCLHA